MSDLESKLPFLHRLSLTVKIVGLTLIAGLAVVIVSNFILTRQVEEAFQNQLFTKLDQQTLEGRERLDKYLKSHYQLGHVILAQASFQNHLAATLQDWQNSPATDLTITTYNRKPSWLPSRTILRTFAQASLYLLLDQQGQVREVYNSGTQSIPLELRNPDPFLVQASHNENFMTTISGTPHVVSAASVLDKNDLAQATILLATPIDDELLSFLQPPYTSNQIAALVTGLKPFVLSSSDPATVPKNMALEDFKKDFFIFEKLVFNYEYSDLLVSYVHFISRQEVKALARPLIVRERIQLIMISAAFIITLSMAMIALTRRIKILSQSMVNFSQKTLGTTGSVTQSGDQISILDHEFQLLTKEVLAANQAQVDLRQSILQSIPAPIFFHDENNILLGCNTAFEDFVGIQRQALIGQKIDEILPQQSAAILLKYNNRLIKDGGRKFYEETIQDSDGQERDLFICKAFFKHGIESQGRIVATMTDITDLRQAERDKENLESQLRQSQKMESIGTLAAGIAHDFNNVLTPILGFSELIKLKLPANHEAIPHLESILQASYRAKDMVQRILAFSRQEEKKKIAVDLNSLLKEVVKLLRTSLPSTIEIQLILPDRETLILADPTQIHQTIMNLGTNAYHAMKEGGGVLTVSLSTLEVDGDHPMQPQLPAGKVVKLDIKDNGCGIPAAVLDRIFEPYFTTRAPGEGSGMGLSVVLGLIQSHHGHIEVESKPDEGTTFSIYLPGLDLKQEAEMEDTGKKRYGELPRGTETILVVDDEELNALVLEEMLVSLGYHAISETSSAEALEHFKKNQAVDLVITDRTMPDLTGMELAAALHEIKPSMPVIICSGNNEGLDEKGLHTLGIADLLPKPVLIDQLAQMVRRVLDDNLA